MLSDWQTACKRIKQSFSVQKPHFLRTFAFENFRIMQKAEIEVLIETIINRLNNNVNNGFFDAALLKKDALELYESAILLEYAQSTLLEEEDIEVDVEPIIIDKSAEEKPEIESSIESDEQAEISEPQIEEKTISSQKSKGNVNEKRSNETYSVLDKLQKKPISNLKHAIGINDRFSFINELFKGNVEAYSRAIEELNHLESFSAAQILINHDFLEKYKWDEEDSTYLHFLQLVERRYL